MSSVRTLLLGALGSFLLAVITWVVGLERGKLMSFRPADEYCGGQVKALSWHLIPLTHQCQLTDGTSRELVPVWVNPLVFVSLAATLVLVVLAMRAANRP
ncbi:hypothetical protein ODJ79_11390 [Actinoplanes sp. KI2]|uniref:hypothetical protein n=1 Tax=Actinoplanes sp. KI2 TaxID=2983315 RepID=UPI0021D577E1|nr:hypothetical protein [Actinoplanes sp. KI2]MCU7724320.1 hypothetical protein [Actinoplanes sp. KI2]